LLKAKPNYERGIELAEYYIREKKVNPKAWEAIFTVYLKVDSVATPEGKELIAESVLRLTEYLDELNSKLPKEIRPDMMTEMLLWAGLHKEDPESLYMIDSRVHCDRDNDGRSDLIICQSGSELRWRMELLKVNQNLYLIKVYQSADKLAKVYVDGAELPGNYSEAEGCYLFLLVPGAEKQAIEISADPSGDPYFTIMSAVTGG
jgi:hypothetical protein